jgi:amino acid adenylation domain-containing protein
VSDTKERGQSLSLDAKRTRLKALMERQAEHPQMRELSFGQERLWFLDQLQPDSPFYNMTEAVRMEGRLNVPALEQTFGEMTRRHESLRTTFQVQGRRPVQVIAPPQPFRLPVVDLTTLPPDQRGGEALRLIAEEFDRPFDLSLGPLFRLTLLKLGEQDHVLVNVMHHIISDGWSMGIFGQEVSALYTAFAVGRPSPLPDLPIQYADFAQWQREWLKGDVLEGQLAYWKEQLTGVPVLQLPTDFARPVLQSHRGAAVAIQLTPALTQGLKALSRREGVTLFMVLLAAFQTLLFRYSGQTDFAVGTPVANRTRMETEGIIGFFVNTLALRTDLSGNPTFRELLGRVREVALGAYSHQDVPFEKLVEVLQPERAMDHHPLVQVLFTLQNTPGDPAVLPDLALSPVSVESTTAKFDLDLNLSEGERGLEGAITYCSDLWDSGTISRMVRHFRNLLEAIVANPDGPIDRLPLMSEAERHQVVTGWNQTATAYPRDRCIQQWIEEQAAARPDALAIAAGAQSLSFGELNRQANQVAHFLRAQGVGTGVPVALWMERSPALIAAMVGVMKAGGAYVPIDPAYPAERVAHILADAGAPLLLTQERAVAELPEVAARVITVDGAAAPWSADSDANPAAPGKPEEIAYVIYTSGSTGRPKGVEVHHGALLNLIWWFRRAYGLTPEDRVTFLSGISFDASVSELWPALSAGASLHLPDEASRGTPTKLRDWLVSEQVTVAFAPTPMAEALLGLDWPEEVPLRVLYTGGDKLRLFPPDSLPFQVADNYGPTECACIATCALVSPASRAERVPHIGRPIDNVQIYILDGQRQPVPIGVPGELYIGGESVGHGYRNQPEMTADRFLPNPFGPGRIYRTGDLARFLPDRNIEFLGRADNQVKIRGFRIELGEIEAVLAQHPDVHEAVVLAREDEPGAKWLVAYVVPHGETAPDKGDLRQFLRRQLPEYMVPAAFVTLPTLPLTRSGKVDRNALPAPEGGRESLGTPYEAPRTPTEAALAAIWAEVLGLERVGIHDHFFELGGHSLLATQVVTRARAALGVELALRSLFEAPTVADLAQTVDGLAADA